LAPNIRVNFFIVYSRIYQAPVLYFLPVYLDEHNERILSLSESATMIFPELVYEHVLEAAIGLGENPATGVMMYFLHPCNTATFMQTVKESSATFDYLNSWLSFIPISANIKD